MSEINKSHWVADKNQIHAQVGFTKVDKENRLVSGFATLDNEDTHDDVVEAVASRQAFERFRGNIREMHQPIAAGRLVDFYEDSYFDPKTKKMHKGIFVQAYVSKGAQDTWEKVLDGTLTGFSIGGNIKKSETEVVKVKGPDGEKPKPVRFIKEYDLIELSLVDNPANPLANVFSITKSDTGSVIKGMVTDVEVVNVFWCETDKLAKNSASETADCRVCGNEMQVIGWFENGEDETTQVEETVNKFLRQREDDNVTTNGEGGVKKMANEEEKEPIATDNGESAADNVEETNVPTEEAQPVEEVTSEEVTEQDAEATEETVPVEEVASEPDFEKLFDGLKDSVRKSLDDNKTAVETAVSEVETKVTAEVSTLTKSVDEKISGLTKQVEELSEALGSISKERENVEKRIDALESSTAIKKSNDVSDTSRETSKQKGFWAGAILGE